MSTLVLLATMFASQLGLPQSEKATFDAHFASDSVVVGGVVDLVVTADIQEGWHVYDPLQNPEFGIPVSITIKGGNFEVAGGLKSSQAAQRHVIGAGDMELVYLWQAGSPSFVVPVKVNAEEGEKTLVAEITYQVCNDQQCLPVKTSRVLAKITVKPSLKELLHGQVSVSAETDGEFAPNSEVGLTFNFQVEDGWHIYGTNQDAELGVPLQLIVEGVGVEISQALSSATEPIVHLERVGNMKLQYLFMEGEFKYSAKIMFGDEVPNDFSLAMTWQTCNDSVCLPQETKVFDELSIGATSSISGGDFPGDGGLPTDFWKFIFAAMAAGFATLLTPCVFPMIPVTISYFTKRAEAGKGTPLGNATAYASGIVFTFAGIGVGAALVLGPGGANMIGSNPWVNFAIGVLFLVLGVSLLGFFEIQPPKFLANLASKKQADGQTQSGYLPVALMAIAFSITAFTCTVGFVGAVFVLGLQMGLPYLIGGMFVYGLTFALPFFFLALFPSRLQSMPNAGAWMNTVKICAGFIELIAALKFFSNSDLFWDLQILTWPVFLAASGVITLLWAAYMLGAYKLPYDYERPKPTLKRGVFAAVLLFLAVGMFRGAADREYKYHGSVLAFLPPADYGLNEFNEHGHKMGAAHLSWIESYEDAFEWAKQHNQPLFIDFTGVTCVNCRRMEYEIFPHADVKPLLEQFTRGELWVDKPPHGTRNTKLQIERFNQIAQPFYAIIDPRNDETLITFPGYDPNPQKFKEFLQDGLEAYNKK
ncbi:MAG: protein-disulfide reductase DsbD family protein [Planctomycetota bacterium]|nr:protein-disulfide reductase DsbD family protein [Planctomycetota bacterium]